MAYLVSVLGFIVSLGFTAAVSVMNWRYGMSIGRSADDQLIFAIVGGGVDAAKILMPFYIWYSWKNARILPLLISTTTLVGLVAYSIAGIAGFADLNRSITQGALADKSEVAKGLRLDLERKQKERDALGTFEAPSVVAEKRAALKQDKRWTTSRECTDASVAPSRQFCADLKLLEAEEQRGVEASRIDATIATLREKISSLAGVANVDRGDPRASVISRVLGYEMLSVQTAVTWLFVGIVECMSTFGVFVALNHGELRRKGTATAAAVPARHTSIDEKTLANLVIDVAEPREDGKASIQELHRAYQRWRHRDNDEPLQFDEFARSLRAFMNAAGFQTVGVGSDMYVIGITMKPK